MTERGRKPESKERGFIPQIVKKKKKKDEAGVGGSRIPFVNGTWCKDSIVTGGVEQL